MKKDQPIRKSVTLPESLWQDVADFRFANRIGTEAEAVRQLIHHAIMLHKFSGKRDV